MNKENNCLPREINTIIIRKLKDYPVAVSELAIKAIQQSETLPEATVLEVLHSYIREIVRKHGG